MTASVTAVVLAGGTLEESLQQVVPPVKHKAWIPLGGRLLVERVLNALHGSSRIAERVLVASPADVPARVRALVDTVAEPGPSPLLSLESGLQKLSRDDLPVLVIPCDMCFLEPLSIEDFLDRCARRSADLYYSYVRRETSEARYPGLRHTWVKLREGTFCGGGLMLCRPQSIQRARAFLDSLTQERKRPWQLARLLGPKIILKWVFGQLSIADLEERTSLHLRVRAVGIESPHPDVGFNVDAPEELATALSLVEPTTSSS